MKPGKRFGLSAEQKIDVWCRWKAGQTLHEIGRAFGKEHSSIRCLVSRQRGDCSSRPAAIGAAKTLGQYEMPEITVRTIPEPLRVEFAPQG